MKTKLFSLNQHGLLKILSLLFILLWLSSNPSFTQVTTLHSADFNTDFSSYDASESTSNLADWIRTTLVSVDGNTINSGGTNYVYLNSDAGSGSGDSYLTSPTFATTGYENISVSFRHYFEQASPSSNSTIYIGYSINGGSTWTDIDITGDDNGNRVNGSKGKIGASNDFKPMNVAIPVGNQSNVKIRFRYNHSVDWVWAIDDIKVIGVVKSSWDAKPSYSGCTNPTFSDNTESINQVTFNTITNNTNWKGKRSETGSSEANTGGNYQDFTSISTQVTPGSSYTLTVWGHTSGNFTNYIRAYFDWNGDGDFADAGESIDIGTFNKNDNGSVSKSITIPASATGGITRMRIIKNFNADPSGSCGSVGSYGQAEDYTLFIAQNYAAQVTSINYGSSDWCIGEDRTVSITIKNTGTRTWYKDAGSGGVTSPCSNTNLIVGLAFKWNGDSWFDSYTTSPFTNRNPLPSNVAPGASVTFTFPVRTPLGDPTGSNNLSINLIAQECQWFVNPGTVYTSPTINIISSPTITGGSEVCANGSIDLNVAGEWVAAPVVTGYSSVVNAGNQSTYTFTNTSTSGTFVLANPITADYLVISGGGSGGGIYRYMTGNPQGGGGGGAGGLAEQMNATIPANSYTVTVGGKGIGVLAGANSGGLSAIAPFITVPGGGYGGYLSSGGSNLPATGASGGGGRLGANGASGTSPYGNYGGNSTDAKGAGGGGGAGSVGTNASGSVGGNGGSGVMSVFLGTTVCAGGGGGGVNSSASGSGGSGIGGNGGPTDPSNGVNASTASYGCGGGGAKGQDATFTSDYKGGDGSQGIVIIRYKSPKYEIIATTGTATGVIDPITGLLTVGPGAGTITVKYTNEGGCSNTKIITVNGVFRPGVIKEDQSICDDVLPATFTQVTAPSGGNGGYTYQWQKASALTGAWTDITGATSANFSETTNLTADTYYRRKVTNECGIAYATPATPTTDLKLHYKFDTQVEPTTNLLPKNIATFSSFANWTCDDASPANVTRTLQPGQGYNGKGAVKIQKNASATGGYFQINLGFPVAVTAGQTYTASIKYKRQDAGTNFAIGDWGGPDGDLPTWTLVSDEAIDNGWRLRVYKHTYAAGGAAGFTFGVNSTTPDKWLVFSDFQLELGDHATPFTVGASTTASVIDYSGNGNNGTITATTSPAWTADNNNGVNGGAYLFDGTNDFIIAHPSGKITGTQITYSAWAYMGTWSASPGRIMSCTEGGGWNFEYNGSGKINAPIYSATSSGYLHATATIGYDNLSPGWHLFTATFDGYTQKLYIDGVLAGQSATAGTVQTIGYNAGNRIFIGAEAAGNATTPIGPYFKGKIDDVRIYSTALCSSDIKDLYKHSAALHVNVRPHSDPPTASTGGGTYCHGNKITLTQSGGINGAGSVNVWYAADGETSATPANCANEGFVELWNEFSYDFPCQSCKSDLRNTTYSIANGIVSLNAGSDAGGDPYISMYPLPNNQTINAGVYKYVNIRYRVTNYVASGVSHNPRLSVLWTKTPGCYQSGDPYPWPGDYVRKDINTDGQWHIVSVPVYTHTNWNGTVTGLRLDYFDPWPHNGNNGSKMDIDFLIVSKLPMIGEGASITLSPGDPDVPTAKDEYYPTQTTTYYGKKIDSCEPTDCVSETVVLPITGTALANNNESATCVVKNGETVHFYHSSGRYICAVKATTADLGSVTSTAYIEPSTPIYDACNMPGVTTEATATLKRHWVVTPTTNNTARVILPFSNAEYNDLVTVSASSANPHDNVTSYVDLKLTKYSGPIAVDNNFPNNCIANGGSGTMFIFDQAAPLGGGTITTTNNFYKNITGAHYVRYDIPSFSELWLHASNINSPLPITLTQFNGNCDKDVVQLTWTTATENNVDRFEIYRSRDGQTWELVGSVEAIGNSSTANSYQLTDEVGIETMYYRLRSVDNDGQFEDFNPISVICKIDGSSWSIHPVPTATQATVTIVSANDSDDELSIIDVKGRVIYQQGVQILSGVNSIPLDVRRFSEGTYFIRLKNNTMLKPLKFVKMN